MHSLLLAVAQHTSAVSNTATDTTTNCHHADGHINKPNSHHNDRESSTVCFPGLPESTYFFMAFPFHADNLGTFNDVNSSSTCKRSATEGSNKTDRTNSCSKRTVRALLLTVQLVARGAVHQHFQLFCFCFNYLKVFKRIKVFIQGSRLRKNSLRFLLPNFNLP